MAISQPWMRSAVLFAGAADRRPVRQLVRSAVALGIVAVAAAVLLAFDVDRVAAALFFIGLVVLTAQLGVAAAATSAVAAFLALNYWFVPTPGSFTFESFENLFPLVDFAAAAALSETVGMHWQALRARASVNEAAATEARIEAAVNEARAHFLASMTHNLRTPLASIASAASTLTNPALDDRPEVRADLAGAITAQTDRLDRLVEKVLTIARLHAGVVRPELQTVDVADLARGAIHHVQPMRRDHRIELQASGQVDAEVDPQMIELVLVNLLENALRYSPPDREITVATRAVAGERCEIQVIDHGVGVAAHDRERLFEEFVRLDERSDGAGAGLGLAIARAFLATHDGTIRVGPTPGGGATFTVTLPTSLAER